MSLIDHTFHTSQRVYFRFIFPTTRLGPESQFSDFLDGLGPAQIVGRQTLATPPMGKTAAYWVVYTEYSNYNFVDKI